MRKELSLDEVKQIEVEILDYVDSFCREKGIKYFIDSGTLLGAVRHGGFIPWDDDIDIVMPRSDYNSFIESFPNDGRFRLLAPEKDPNYIYAFAKVVDSATELYEDLYADIDGYGIYIDVFPLDGLPDGKIRRKWFQRKLWFYRAVCTAAIREKRDGDSLKFRILSWVTHKIGFRYFLNKIRKIICTYDINHTKYGGPIVVFSKKYKKIETAHMKESTELIFEGKKYLAPLHYHEYLTAIYGDYMKLPPKEQQVTHHYFKAYRKEQ